MDDRSTYIGYYLILAEIKYDSVTVHCQCSFCYRIVNTKYCGACGHATEEVGTTKKSSTRNLRQLLDSVPEFKGRWLKDLSPRNTTIGLITIDAYDTQNLCYQDFDFTAEDLAPKPMDDELTGIITDFLAEFRAVYGEDSITLKYGIYSYDD